MKMFLFTNVVWAQAHAAGHDPHGATVIPLANIGVQAFNLLLLVALLGFLLRKSLKQHFAQRATEFKELVDRADKARRDAEQNHQQIKEKLVKLEQSAQQSVQRAFEESEGLRTRLMQEAKTLVGKMELEAQRTAAVELEKAKSQLRHTLLTDALLASGENLRKNLGVSDQKALQNEFVEKIEMVGR